MSKAIWRRILHHPFLAAGVGLVLAATGLIEVVAPFLDSDPSNDWAVQSEHGQALFGILLFVRSLGEGIEQLRKVKGGLHEAGAALGRGDEVRAGAE